MNKLPSRFDKHGRVVPHMEHLGRSQPRSPGWARFPLSSFFLTFPSFFSYISLNFPHLCPHFGSPGGQLAHPGRPWLCHCDPEAQSCANPRKKCDNLELHPMRDGPLKLAINPLLHVMVVYQGSTKVIYAKTVSNMLLFV